MQVYSSFVLVNETWLLYWVTSKSMFLDAIICNGLRDYYRNICVFLFIYIEKPPTPRQEWKGYKNYMNHKEKLKLGFVLVQLSLRR